MSNSESCSKEEDKSSAAGEKERNNVKKRQQVQFSRACDYCPKKYRSLIKLKYHFAKEHNVERFLCKECDAIFDTKNDYEFHVKTHSDKLICDSCGADFVRKRALVKHLKSYHGFVFADEHLLTNGGERCRWQCETCGCVCGSAAALRDHAAKKHSGPNYFCYYCGRGYKLILSFEAHVRKHERLMARVHGTTKSIEDKHECKACSQSFDSESRLREHELATHSAADCDPLHREAHSFKCKFCDKTCKTNAALSQHERSHRTRPEMKCQECGRRFASGRALMWHGRLHSGERPFVCAQCGRGFISLNRRNQHMLCAHTPPTKRCPLCPATFHLNSMVNTHIKKVHLTDRKRRNRISKQYRESWRSKVPVPLQELSVEVQSELLECNLNNETELSHTNLNDVEVIK